MIVFFIFMSIIMLASATDTEPLDKAAEMAAQSRCNRFISRANYFAPKTSFTASTLTIEQFAEAITAFQQKRPWAKTTSRVVDLICTHIQKTTPSKITNQFLMATILYLAAPQGMKDAQLFSYEHQYYQMRYMLGQRTFVAVNCNASAHDAISTHKFSFYGDGSNTRFILPLSDDQFEATQTIRESIAFACEAKVISDPSQLSQESLRYITSALACMITPCAWGTHNLETPLPSMFKNEQEFRPDDLFTKR